MDIRTEERYEDDFNQGNLFIMKRSGERVPFDESKIVRAIEKANAEVTIPLEKMSEEKIDISLTDINTTLTGRNQHLIRRLKALSM